MRTPPTATVHIVTRDRDLRGVTVKRHDIPSVVLPWIIARRATVAYRVGLATVRALGDGGDIVAVSVSDGRRVLASWRRMDSLPGFTGTHNVHPLIVDAMPAGVETFGAYLARRVAAVEG